MEELKVVTLNAWGLLYISKDVEDRMEALANELAKGHFHIVALQEMWCKRHFDMIADKVKNILPYSYYFRSGFMGSGCAVISQYPIQDAIFYKFMHNGNFWDISYCDWYAGKGVGCVRIKHPLKDIYFFNTHLHAEYGKDTFTECRTLQMHEIIQFINHLTRQDDAIILCGDFNHCPETLGIQALQQLTDLTDTFTIAKEKLSNCMTLDSVKNNYNDPLDGQQRLDYIFINNAFGCVSCDLALDRIPDSKLFFSDHTGYTVTLQFNQVVTPKQKSIEDTQSVLKKLSKIVKDGGKLSNEIIWSNLLIVFLMTMMFVVLPLIGVKMFPSSDTWLGKILLIIQVFTIAIATIYFIVVMLVNRRISVAAFQKASSEIDVKLNASDEAVEMKKVD